MYKLQNSLVCVMFFYQNDIEKIELFVYDQVKI